CNPHFLPNRQGAQPGLRDCSLTLKNTGDRLLDLFGFGFGVWRAADGAADDDVVGPFEEGFFDSHNALLIVRDESVFDRADARTDNKKVVAEVAPQLFRLKAGGNDPIATDFEGAPRPGQNEGLH